MLILYCSYGVSSVSLSMRPGVDQPERRRKLFQDKHMLSCMFFFPILPLFEFLSSVCHVRQWCHTPVVKGKLQTRSASIFLFAVPVRSPWLHAFFSAQLWPPAPDDHALPCFSASAIASPFQRRAIFLKDILGIAVPFPYTSKTCGDSFKLSY